MKFLIVGLGSMGKRRLRCLKTLGYDQIAGFDPREDRRREVSQNQKISVFPDLAEALQKFSPDALIISVPPAAHHEYMKIAAEKGLPFFVEASVVDTDMDKIKAMTAKAGVLAAPSCTLLFHPAIRKIGEIVRSGRLGKISNVLMHSGQYLPDWHTYEKVSEYYVSNPTTGGGREIVPFELTWLTALFGFPKRVCGQFRKTIKIEGAEAIDDTYNCLFDYGNFLSVLTVDVVSRYATRRLTINGDKAQLYWSWDKNAVTLYDPSKGAWEELDYKMSDGAKGYNAHIGENMYIEELDAFVQSIKGPNNYPNTLENDHKILKLLYAVEESDKTSRFVEIKS